MTRRPYFRLSVGLIVLGIMLIALNVWLLFTFHLPPGVRGGNGALGVIGGTMLMAGVMILLGF